MDEKEGYWISNEAMKIYYQDFLSRLEERDIRIKELIDGIETHKGIKILRGMSFWEGDMELYKLIEKEKP